VLGKDGGLIPQLRWFEQVVLIKNRDQIPTGLRYPDVDRMRRAAAVAGQANRSDRD
jgi:hypothetical protein